MNIICSAIDNDRVFFYEKDSRALLELSKGGEIILLGFVHSAWNATHLFVKDGMLFFVGNNGTIICVTDNDRNKGVRADIIRRGGNVVFSYIKMIGDKIVFFPLDLEDNIVVYNILDRTCEISKSWRTFADKYLKNVKSPFFNSLSREIYIPVLGTNTIIMADIENGVECRYLTENVEISGALFDGNRVYYSLTRGADIGVADRFGNVLNVYRPYESQINGEFSNIIDCCDRICCLPRYGDRIAIIEKEGESIYCINLNDYDISFPNERKAWSRICNCIRIGDRIVFFGNGIKESFETDIRGNDLKMINKHLIEDLCFNNLLTNRDNAFIGGENVNRNLMKYISFLSGKRDRDVILYEHDFTQKSNSDF